MTIWFSSDWHFHHENILKFCDRPFADVWEMNEGLIARHNINVKPSDHYYHLGDVTMERDGQGRGLEILKRLNGHGRLIMGNHDHYHVKHYMKHFEKVMAMWMMDNIRFTHIPVHPTSMGNALANVHGHIHNQPSPEPVMRIDNMTQRVTYKPYVNVCVEMTNYHPISFEEVKDLVRKGQGEFEGVKV